MAILLVAVLAFGGLGIGAPARNAVGFLVGSVLGFVVLAWFTVVDNRGRPPRLYRDWHPLRSRPVMRTLCLASWALGLVHAYFWALDLTRLL